MQEILFLLALVVLASPTPPAPFAVHEGGGGAELEEGGHDLERERDAGEGVCRVRWVWAGWNVDRSDFVLEDSRARELRGVRGRRVVAHHTVYRREGRIE